MFLCACALTLIALGSGRSEAGGVENGGVENGGVEDGTVGLAVTIDGRPLGGDDLVLQSAVTRVVVSVENLGRSTLEVDSVRLSGTVLGLTFFDYDTRVQTGIPARGSATWTVDIDLRDLGGRANGTMPVEVAIRDRGLTTVAHVSGTADVRGSLFSLYGLFGLGLAILTGLLMAVALLPLGRHAVAVKPWQRGLRFVPAGCAIGLFGVFALSAIRLLAPAPGSDFAVTVAAVLTCFTVGALTARRNTEIER